MHRIQKLILLDFCRAVEELNVSHPFLRIWSYMTTQSLYRLNRPLGVPMESALFVHTLQLNQFQLHAAGLQKATALLDQHVGERGLIEHNKFELERLSPVAKIRFDMG